MLKLASQLNKTGKLYYTVLTCSKKHTAVHDVYVAGKKTLTYSICILLLLLLVNLDTVNYFLNIKSCF